MRIFQYKILNNILYLNNRIIGFTNLVTQNLHCVHFAILRQTMTHPFCHCSNTIQLWSSLSNWCMECLTLPTPEPSTAILSFWDIKDEKCKLVNHILMLFKYFIYANRNIKHAVNFYTLKLFISSVQKIEQKIVFNRKCLEQHFPKWQPIAHLVN